MEPKVIVIAGPTCSGKTTVSLMLAERINAEIISADSRQVYRHLDIGTAKPGKDQLAKTKHYFIDILEPDEEFNASKFENEALAVIQDIILRNKVPVVVGGSGLYIKALVDGIFDAVGVDSEYRRTMNVMRVKFGNEFLFSELKKVDPVSAVKMLPQNWKRVMRALEVYHLTGKPICAYHSEHKRTTDFSFRQYGLRWDRNLLYENIERRVDEMIEMGLIGEVREILKMNFDEALNSLNTVGYKEIISYLNGSLSLERAVGLIKRNTRRYAKRQLTWFKPDDRIIWFDVKDKNSLSSIADEIIFREKLA